MRKRVLSLGLALALCLGLLPVTARAYGMGKVPFWAMAAEPRVQFAGGDGTEDNPYQIATAEQLDAVRNDLSAHYVQINDIDMEDFGNFTPIGAATIPVTPDQEVAESSFFRGTYDGQGYQIFNLVIGENDINGVGLFWMGAEKSILKNINIVHGNISVDKTGTNYVEQWHNGTIYGVSAGMIAAASDGTVSNCSASGEISVINCNSAYVGGILGFGNPDHCTNYTNIKVLSNKDSRYSNDGTVCCGGIVGQTRSVNGPILECVNYGKITAISGSYLYCGGISGKYGAIEGCANYGDVRGEIHSYQGWSSFAYQGNVGGIVGATSSDKNNNCVNYGNISGYKFDDDSNFICCAGGIAGYIGYYSSGTISNCYNFGNVVAKERAGRIAAGLLSSNASNLFSVDTVTVNGVIPTDNIGTNLINGASLTQEQLEYIVSHGGIDSFPTPPTTTGSVQFLAAYDAATRQLTFGDPTRVSPYTYTLADSMDASGMNQLLNKYVLVTTEQQEDNSLAYTITDIQPVTSALGKVTATGEHSLTIDGTEYPVREDWILAASVGDEVLYHTHNGTIMGYSVLEEKHGILEGWDNTTKRVTIDGAEYPTNFLTDLTNIESYLQRGVYFVTGGSADYCPLLKVTGFYYPGGKLEDFDVDIYHAKWLAKGGNGADTLQNDTPSEILIENIEEHNGDVSIDLWRSFELVFDTLDDVSTLYEFAVEPKDVYSAQLLNALEASVSYDVVASEYEDGLKISRQLISDVSSAMKANHGIDLSDDLIFQRMTAGNSEEIEKYISEWFKENQPDLADMDKSFKWISKGLKTVSGIEDFAEYCASCYALSEVSGSMETVLRRAYEKSVAVYGPLDNMTLALMDCVEVVNTGADDLWQRIGMEGVTVVGEGFAKYLVKEVLWSHITSAISTKCPEVAILQVGYSAGKTISNWLCDTDDSVEQYLKMDYITDLEALVDGVYNDLRIDFYQNPTKELAQAYLSAMELSFRLRDADSEIAYQYTDILSEDLLHKIFGNQSYEDLKKSINSRRDEYAGNYANAQTGWVPYLEEDYPGSGLYEKYEHLTQAANLTKLAKEIKAACPVNVYVYDQLDSVVASVVDGRVSCDGGNVMIALLGDEKIIRLYESADYRVEYVGYDDGGMDVTISEFDEDETAVRTVNYYDVPLTNRTTYALASEDETRKPYILEETSGGGTVEHDYDSMDNTPAHTVKVISGTLERNGEIFTEAAARKGETLVLSAYVPEGYRFVRWEPDAETVSIADIHGKKTAMIMPDGDVTVTAVMEKVETVPVNPPDSDTAHDGPAAEEWENPYSDVDQGAWYYAAVKYVTENDLMNGYGGNRFGPGDLLSRAQFAQILYNKEGGPRAEGNPFKDVISTAWYAQTVAWAAESGIVKGYGNGSFGPEDPITREQLAAMLWRYAGSPESGNALNGFADGHETSAWAWDALGWAVEQGIVTGKGDSILDPQGEATRAEVAVMLQRYIQITSK